jgi:hypothetical protein
MVDWFNAVDLTYRTELRELNELNFARFDAKVGERLAELRSSIEATLRAEMDQRFTGVDQRFEVVLDKIRDAKTSMLKWMFGFWIGTALVILGSRLAR